MRRPSKPLSRARLLLVGLSIAGTLTVASPSQAQLLKLSPGPLSQAHSRWDDVGPGCTRCHQLAGKVSGATCLACHAALKGAIDEGHGLHVTFKADCMSCHTEHKGRAAAITDWKDVGHPPAFEHKRTGFPLAGFHEAAKCTACHKRHTSTGITMYAGLSTACASCHKNPHDFSKKELTTRCLSCHPMGGVVPHLMKASQVPFDHGAETGVALEGKHAEVLCVKCHKGAKMSMATLRTCGSCHKDKHGVTFDRRPCQQCHQPSRPFARAIFDHKTTDYPLEGEHADAKCRQCHTTPKAKPSKECASCHKATHKNRFDAFKCLQCHQAGGVKKMVFDHDTLTRFELSGRHDQVQCRSCHRGKKPFEFEKFPTPACVDCHRHKNAHKGQFANKPCTECHISGSKKMVFNHDTYFPLAGAHQRLAATRKCGACHPLGSYKTGKTACIQCHKDSHAGQLGTDCKRCHSPEVKFAKVVFDHTRAPFQLVGSHQKVACAKCHPNRKYKTGKSTCFDCHEKTEPHAGKLGKECDRCHLPEKGAPRFAHETMTQFKREGAHLKAPCSFCHQPPPAGGPMKVAAIEGQPAGPVDLKFPLMGKKCADCHADQHNGTNGPACETCHKPTSFKEVSATIHDTGPFRLEGVHQTLPCARCHGGGRLLAGTGESCVQCHRDKDAHRNGLGPFCGDCHQQTDWRPARFNHLQTGFELRGAHRAAACSDCHGLGTYQGRPTDCEACHQADAARVKDPIHTPELRPCDRCHTEAGFLPARQSHPEFPLVGRHRLMSCRNCHRSGQYAGTPDQCEACHLARYTDPFTTPNHLASAYPTSCADCHSPIGWIPARKP